MRVRTCIFVFFSVWMLIWTAWAGEKVAVLDFQSLLASEDYGIAVAEILRTELVGLGDYTIIERGMLQQIIEEQSLQLSGAIDSETAVEIGKLTGAQLVVTGSIVKTGSVYTINARFVDVQTGIAKVGQNIRGQGEDEISNMVHQLALIITGKTVATEEVIAEPTSQATTPVPASEESTTPQQASSSTSPSESVLIFSFENLQELQQWHAESGESGSHMEISENHATEGQNALHVMLQPYNNWQAIRTAALPVDWSAYNILAFDVYYDARSTADPLPLLVRIDDERTNRLQRDWFMKPYMLNPGSDTIRLYLEDVGTKIDTRHVKQFIISTNKLSRSAEVYIDNVRFEHTFPPAPTEPFQISFEAPGEAAVNFQPNGRMIRIQQVKKYATHGEVALKLSLPRKLPANHYPGIRSVTFPRDWSNYHTFRCDVFMEDTKKSERPFVIRIDDVTSSSSETRFHWEGMLKPGENQVLFSLEDVRQILDITRIIEVHMYLEEPNQRVTLYIDNIVLE